jgi:hypothetical protein
LCFTARASVASVACTCRWLSPRYGKLNREIQTLRFGAALLSPSPSRSRSPFSSVLDAGVIDPIPSSTSYSAMPSQSTLRQLVSLALLLSLASPFVTALPVLQARDGAVEASAISFLAAVSEELVQAVNIPSNPKLTNSSSLSRKVALPVYYSALVAVGASYT